MEMKSYDLEFDYLKYLEELKNVSIELSKFMKTNKQTIKKQNVV